MTATIPLNVLELACSRLCHDLISPVGAINNGVELCQELDGGMADEAMALIADSGRRAAARLRAFRLAFGAAGGQAGLGAEDARSALGDYLEGGKVALDWPAIGPAPAPWPIGAARLAVLAGLLAEEALIHGGRIVADLDGLPAAITLTATGRTAELSDPSRQALDGRLPTAELTARTVVAYIARQFADAAGARLAASSEPAEAADPARLRLVLRLAI